MKRESHQRSIQRVGITENLKYLPILNFYSELQVLDLPASFEPIKGYEHSNTNYLLSSIHIGNITRQGNFQFIKGLY